MTALDSTETASTGTVTVPAQAGPAASETDAFAERVFGNALGTLELLSMHFGDRLGWYRAMADGEPVSPADLAVRTGSAERYAREWLEQQATAGIVTVTPDGRYLLPPAAAEAFTDEHSLNFMMPLVRFLAPVAAKLPELESSYRTGGGVSWSDFGDDMRRAQAEANRPWFTSRLAPALAKVDSLDATLRRPGVHIADIGYGYGWSSIALAKAYPQATVDGYDVDEPSAEAAWQHAYEAGVARRVSFAVADAVGIPEDFYDVVFAFECLHDMPQPVSVLSAARRALRPGGVVVVMDEAVGESLSAPGDEVERFMYAVSLVVCLPDGLSHQPSAGTGTVLRPPILRRYAAEAGFSSVEVLPIEDFSFFRFYRLDP
jgi:SAM-dependent methyltransferase